jgi:hypothetical protein
VRSPLVAAALTALLLGAAPAPLATVPEGDAVHSDNMSHVANVRWEDGPRASDGRTIDAQGGTDVEFATIDGRDYAIAGSYRNGLQIIDVTDPQAPVLVTTYECRILQGDTQTFTRTDEDGTVRHYVTYTADSGYNQQPSRCFGDAGANPGVGTVIIDVTDPAAPRAVTWVAIAGGSHNQTVHPSGDYLYNSNSGSRGFIEVIDIRDLSDPQKIFDLPTEGDDSHDLTFNPDGTRAYSAALDHTLIIDTEDPANPEVISSIFGDAVTLHHQTDPVSIGDRDYVIINDELNGAGGNEFCPGGGLHVYDVTDEANPEKVGAFFIPEITVAEGARTGLQGTITCTSHVFRIYEEQQLLTIAWFGAGVRVIDLSGLAETPPVSVGVLGQTLTPGMREIGFYRFPQDSDAWSAKIHRFEEDGSAYIFANDQTRGFDVYHYDATASPSEDPGQWLSATAALDRTEALLATGFVPAQRPYCDLRALDALGVDAANA